MRKPITTVKYFPENVKNILFGEIEEYFDTKNIKDWIANPEVSHIQWSFLGTIHTTKIREITTEYEIDGIEYVVTGGNTVFNMDYKDDTKPEESWVTTQHTTKFFRLKFVDFIEDFDWDSYPQADQIKKDLENKNINIISWYKNGTYNSLDIRSTAIVWRNGNCTTEEGCVCHILEPSLKKEDSTSMTWFERVLKDFWI